MRTRPMILSAAATVLALAAAGCESNASEPELPGSPAAESSGDGSPAPQAEAPEQADAEGTEQADAEGAEGPASETPAEDSSEAATPDQDSASTQPEADTTDPTSDSGATATTPARADVTSYEITYDGAPLEGFTSATCETATSPDSAALSIYLQGDAVTWGGEPLEGYVSFAVGYEDPTAAAGTPEYILVSLEGESLAGWPVEPLGGGNIVRGSTDGRVWEFDFESFEPGGDDSVVVRQLVGRVECPLL